MPGHNLPHAWGNGNVLIVEGEKAATSQRPSRSWGTGKKMWNISIPLAVTTSPAFLGERQPGAFDQRVPERRVTTSPAFLGERQQGGHHQLALARVTTSPGFLGERQRLRAGDIAHPGEGHNVPRFPGGTTTSTSSDCWSPISR